MHDPSAQTGPDGAREWRPGRGTLFLALAGLAVVAVLSGGRSERLVIADPASGVRLAWTCGAFEAAARNEPSREVVRARAVDLIRAAEREGGHDIVRAMIRATADPEPGRLERELVRTLCERPEWRTAVLAGVDAPDDEGDGAGGAGAESHRTGEAAPPLVLPLLGPEDRERADTLRLEDLRGRWVYLDVFGSWCGPCRDKYPDTSELARRLERSDTGLVVVGLLYRDRPARASTFFAEHGGQAYPFALLDEATAARWGVTGAPMGFLVSPDGRIVRRCYGCRKGPLSAASLPGHVASLGGV